MSLWIFLRKYLLYISLNQCKEKISIIDQSYRSFVQFWEGSKIQSTCSAFHIYFCFLVILLSSQSNSENFSSEDERLDSSSLGVRKAG